MPSEIVGKSITDLRNLLVSKQVTAKEILEEHLRHLKACEPDVNAFNSLTEDLARAQANKVDQILAKGEPLPPLAGIPIAVKDNIGITGYPTTCSSKTLLDFISPYNATVVDRFLSAGALPVGKTNLDEFAMGSSTENSATKLTHNPWKLGTVPGGSSGGSAAAVAAGQSVVALGSDTGGSIRLPAAFCGVVGMKPTYGMVSRFGLVAFASSLDQIGPFGRSVEDVAIVLTAISGHDQRDSTSFHLSASHFTQDLKAGVKNVRIGIVKELIGEGIDSEIQKAVLSTVEVFKSLGAKVSEVSLPSSKYALPVYYIIATAEASANLARYDGVKYGYRDPAADDLLTMYCQSRQVGFGPEVKRRIMLGTYALSSGYYDAYYKKAQQVRRLIQQEFDQVFANHDILICPTGPTPAPAFGAKTEDPLQMYLMDIATIPANLAGIPGISIPCGFTENGLPVGLQLLAPALADTKLLQAAYAFEQNTDYHKQQSPILSTATVRSQH